MYVESPVKVCPDWLVTEIPQAGRLNCIMKPDFEDGLVRWLDQHAPAQPAIASQPAARPAK